MNLDRFENAYYQLRFPDRQETAKTFCFCYGCGEEILVGEYVLRLEDKYCHPDMLCLIRASEAIEMIAGEDEDEYRWEDE